MTRTTRMALMGTVTTTALLAFASPAAAQSCTVTPAASPTSAVTCDAVTTTDTTNAGTSPATDRNYLVTTAGGDATVDVTGAVNGYGLAITNSAGGANTLSVTNDGGIQIDSGLTASAGGNDALDITAIGATNVDYSGAGDITNLGTTGTALQFNLTGTGNLVANIGGSLTSAVGTGNDVGNGVWVNQTGAGGDVTVNVTGANVNADWVGELIQKNGTGTAMLTNTADIGSLAAAPGTLYLGMGIEQNGTGDITLVNDGTIGSATDRIEYYGAYADIYNAASTASIDISGSGDVYSANTGIEARNSGSGTIDVNYTGAVDSSGAYGITTAATTGATTVTTGDGSIMASGAGGIGINVASGTGAATVTTGAGAVTGDGFGVQVASTGTQSITANGMVTGTTGAGIHSNTTADRMITIGTAGDVTGGTEAILLANTGTATITNNGVVGSVGSDLALNGTAAGTTTFNNTSTGTLNGMLMFGAGDDTLTNAGTFNTMGTTDFGAGADTFTNTGTLNLMGDTVFANLETLDLGGTTNLDTYTLTGTGALINTGTLNSNGGTLTGFTSYSNTGDMYLTGTTTVDALPFDNTGTVYSVDGDATLTGQTVFNNMGTISMVDDAADDTLTIDSDYVGGTGARLAVDVADAMSDMLIVNGDISGTTAVDANLIGTGSLVLGGVQVVNGLGASTDDAFVLGDITGNAGPLASYSIDQVGSDYYLNASLTAAGFEPMGIATMLPDLWYSSANEVTANLNVPYKGGNGLGGWIQAYASREKRGDSSYEQTIGGIDYVTDNRVKTTHLGLQGGLDYGADFGRIGITGGVNRAKGKGFADVDANSWNIGAYAAFGGVTGVHAELFAKYDWTKFDFQNGVFDGDKLKAHSFGLDGQVGYRVPMGGADSSLDIAVGLSQVYNHIDNLDDYGLSYRYRDLNSTRARASARYNLGGAMQPYVSLTGYHEFAGDAAVIINDGVNDFSYYSPKKGTWARVEGGVGGTPNHFPMVAAWADFGDLKGFGARLGFRFGAEAEAAPPPPPPPPPPAEPAPPPATQTCYDGSVILATDTCPVPPPPPPPPPAPERG